MSRIIVKNLPKNINEDRLRKIFGTKGLITDVQLKYTPDGKFRRFAFVGYQTEEEASLTIKHFNNSRIDTNKISVETCSFLGDENKPKAWSKWNAESTANKKLHEAQKEPEETSTNCVKHKAKSHTEKSSEVLQKYKDDPLFEEFLEVQDPNIAKTLLEKVQHKQVEELEEDTPSQLNITDDIEDNDENVEKPANQTISDMEYMKSLMKKSNEKEISGNKIAKVKEKIKLFTLKLNGLPYTCKKKDVKQFFKPLSPYSIRVPRNIKGIAFVGFKQEKQLKKALLKDKSFISGKQVSVMKYEKKEIDDSESQNPLRDKWKNQQELLKNEEDIAESGRIFFRNLSYTTTEDDVQTLFSKYGPITEINLPIDVTTRKQKGFGTVTFLMPEHAVKAYTELDGSILHGRMLHLLPGKAKDNIEDTNDESTNFKKKKNQQLKAQSGSSHNWNSLFLGHNSVAEVIANTYNTRKEDVLDPHGDGKAAVRLALGETQIVNETRKYLVKEGVMLDAFSGVTTKRSKTVILVKNLPADTTSKELNALFSPHGLINRIILPPSGITAIVEFIEPSEARKAFTKLAYTKFKHLPLYLEWAPENSLTTGKTQKSDELKNLRESHKEPLRDENADNATEEREENNDEQNRNEEEEEPEPDTTLFVKNLNFKTTDNDLYKHFESCGKIKYARVSVKSDKNNPKSKLSMGYGFVQFMFKASADKALKTLQLSQLDGKSLELKRSERTLSNEINSTRKLPTQKKQTGTKILIRNIAFQAKKSEILELFRTFGEIKAIRLPKKVGSEQHRGFAFVDFSTKSEAKMAFEQLSQSTHLYGRRLVLEWAETQEDVDDIRKRTADHFQQTLKQKSKKSVLSID